MPIDTIYDFNYSSPTTETREQYTAVGAAAFTLGTYPRAFSGGATFEIWDSAVGGTQLTEGVDYTISQNNNRGDLFYSNQAGTTLYSDVTILNATYQVGNIYITYDVYGSYVSASIITYLQSQIDVLKSFTVSVKTGNYVIQDTDYNTIFSLSGASAAAAFTMPTLADNLNKIYEVRNDDPTYGLTVNGEGAETMGGMNSIELPKQGNRIRFIGGASEWIILDEAISCELKMDTYAGRGSTATKIPYYTNETHYYGNLITYSNDSTNGFVATIVKSGNYSIKYRCDGASTYNYAAITLNGSSQVTVNAQSLAESYCLDRSEFYASDEVHPHVYVGWLDAGDEIRGQQTDASSISALCTMLLSYIGG